MVICFALMNGTSVLQPDFFDSLGRTWGRGLLEDQQFGGGIGWGIGEVPTLLLTLVLGVQWSRSDDRDAKRYDRAADRDGPSAAPETVRGAKIAAERGWTAPAMPDNAEFPPLPEKK